MTPPFIRDIGNALARHKTALMQESKMYEHIEAALRGLGVKFEREVRLNPKHRVDFLCDSGLVIEVKKGTAGNPVVRQVTQYLEFPAVSSALVVAMRAPDFPREMLGKHIYTIELWRFML